MTDTTTYIVHTGDARDFFIDVVDDEDKPFDLSTATAVLGILLDYETQLPLFEKALSAASPAAWDLGEVYFPLTTGETEARTHDQVCELRIRVTLTAKPIVVEGEGFILFQDDHFA